MTDVTGGVSNKTSTVRYEETLAIRDDEGAGGLVRWVRILIVFLVISSAVSVVIVAFVVTRGVATRVGGISTLQELIGALVTDQTLVVAVFALVGLLFFLISIVFVWLFVGTVGRALDKEVHIQVRDEEVSIKRKGSQYWQSSGVDVPSDTITAIEYVDPEQSSFRIELRDFWAPKFLAGRSRNWVRLERAHGPAIYLGSDRPRDLAEAIAEGVSEDVTVQPF